MNFIKVERFQRREMVLVSFYSLNFYSRKSIRRGGIFYHQGLMV